ncbi:transposase [Paenibacillus hemerocallicola]|uniref:Transposase n=1 Tax=Paenibacillus hemerocallicola TaxID=1172614 RepID=A0A5C4SVG6_9BACL|nr:transposase [Paenibacillus hemerocallicola]
MNMRIFCFDFRINVKICKPINCILQTYDEMEGIGWEWQSIDGSLIKAPLALEAVGRNPTDRGKKGMKRSALVDQHGLPLALVVEGPNRHDVKLLEQTLEARVVQPAFVKV